MSSTTGAPPEGGDVDRGGFAVVMFWAFSGVSVVVVALRFIGRYMIRAIGWDDWAMLFTLALMVTYSTFITLIARLGGMRHLYYLSADETVAALRMSWISQPFVVVGFATGKVAVALLLLRIIGPKSFWRKWILRVCIGASLVFSTVDVILTFAQCTPVEGLWDPTLLESGAAHCIDPAIEANESIWLASWNVFVDTLLALLPATLFWKLRLNMRRKIGLCILLGLGIIAAVCAAIKAQFLGSLTAWSDLTWVTYDLYMWSGAELFVIIVCGSIPPIKPIYDRLTGGRSSNSTLGTGYPTNRNSTLKGTHWSSSSHPTSGIDRKIEVFVSGGPRDPPLSPYVAMSDEEQGGYRGFAAGNSKQNRPHAPPRVGSGPIDYPKPGHHIRPLLPPEARMFPAGDITVPFPMTGERPSAVPRP